MFGSISNKNKKIQSTTWPLKQQKRQKKKRKSRSLSFCRPLLRTVPGDEGAWTDGRMHSFVRSFVRAWMICNDVVSVPWFLPFSVHPLTRSGPAVVVAGPYWQKPAGRKRNIYPCIHSSIHSFIHSVTSFVHSWEQSFALSQLDERGTENHTSSGIFRPFRGAAISRSASSVLLLTDVAAIVDDIPSSMNVATWDCNRVRVGKTKAGSRELPLLSVRLCDRVCWGPSSSRSFSRT